ncbi:hypothetical protein PO124_28545 [Bacillus licheniformis]|nr:hypothetical protein [Bacillus licheniformis]
MGIKADEEEIEWDICRLSAMINIYSMPIEASAKIELRLYTKTANIPSERAYREVEKERKSDCGF